MRDGEALLHLIQGQQATVGRQGATVKAGDDEPAADSDKPGKVGLDSTLRGMRIQSLTGGDFSENSTLYQFVTQYLSPPARA